MEPIATVLIFLLSVCFGLAAAVGMLEVIFVLMARPVAITDVVFSPSQGIGAPR